MHPSSSLSQDQAGNQTESEPTVTTVTIAYRTRGMHSWRYRPAGDEGRIRHLDLKVSTNFSDFDYLDEGTFSADEIVERKAGGKVLTWQTSDLITQKDIGIAVPQRLNPGPVVTRISFFAPVCLGFFFLLIASITVVRQIAIHPMHYLFVAAGFASFHVLLAYLVDVITLSIAFIIASIVSTVLTTTYLKAALGKPFPTWAAAGGQVFYLVLFSFSFFLTGYTGLTVALGAVATLAVLMRLTAHTDWHQVFRQPMLSQRAPSSALAMASAGRAPVSADDKLTEDTLTKDHGSNGTDNTASTPKMIHNDSFAT